MAKRHVAVEVELQVHLIDLNNVSRSYGRIQALRDVTLQLQPGTVGLVGNNGAGKSTLLKILLGLLAPDSGSGSVLGCDLRRAGRRLRGQVGYMPEASAIVPLLKGVEFVALSGDLYGMPKRDARRRAHEVLGYVGLGELRYRRLEEYSTGNLQRLKLAAALVHDPQLLLLDEPTSGLDPQGRTGMLRLIEDLIAETEKSVILCTHLLSDVERLCEQVVVLHRGTVIRAGRMAELREVQSNRYHLAWDGLDDPFVAMLARHGISFSRKGLANSGLAVLPHELSTAKLFQLAKASGAVLTQIKRDEEDLERLFFRVTDGHTVSQPEQAQTRETELAHGN